LKDRIRNGKRLVCGLVSRSSSFLNPQFLPGDVQSNWPKLPDADLAHKLILAGEKGECEVVLEGRVVLG
jgi:hypothetical protein